MKMTKTLMIGSLLLCALYGSTSAQDLAKPSPEQWAGCYEIRGADGSLPPQLWGMKFPEHFRLLGTPAIEGWFRVEPPFIEGWSPAEPLFDPKVDFRREHLWPFVLWKPSDKGFAVDWGTGFVGCTVTVIKSGDTLLATAQPWSDDGVVHPKFKVMVRHSSCPEPR